MAHAQASEGPSGLAVLSRLRPSGTNRLAPGELRVRRVVDMIEREEREALLLCTLGQLSVQEVARIVEAPVGAVEDLVKRSLVAIAGEISSGTLAGFAKRTIAGCPVEELEQLVAGRGEGKAELEELRAFLASLKSAFFEIPSRDAESRHVGMAVSAALSMTARATDPRRRQPAAR
jgi:Sigma-70, region 4